MSDHDIAEGGAKKRTPARGEQLTKTQLRGLLGRIAPGEIQVQERWEKSSLSSEATGEGGKFEKPLQILHGDLGTRGAMTRS